MRVTEEFKRSLMILRKYGAVLYLDFESGSMSHKRVLDSIDVLRTYEDRVALLLKDLNYGEEGGFHVHVIEDLIDVPDSLVSFKDNGTQFDLLPAYPSAYPDESEAVSSFRSLKDRYRKAYDLFDRRIRRLALNLLEGVNNADT